MFVREKKGLKWVTLNPGDYFVTDEHLMMTTLLGSCVSACLFDPVNRISGMNHFLLSNRRYSQNLPIFKSEAGRYGIHSMELLINDMLSRGASKKYLRAKAFGGANVLNTGNMDNFYCVGSVNTKFILEFLSLEHIPLESHSLGGNTGRIIRFNTGDYSVFAKKIEKQSQKTLFKEEHSYWKKNLKQQKRKEKEEEICLW